MFAKFANSLSGHGDVVPVPRDTSQVDFEAELGIVISREAHGVAVDDALCHVGGLVCMNDLSARDLQFGQGQWTRGKAIDGFQPVGPVVVTPDEVEDVQNLDIRCEVNGSTMQSSSTSHMIFSVAEPVSFVSRTMTLVPGDLLSTGTPAGVGFAQSPPRFLEEGDEVTVSIDGLVSCN